MGDKKKEKGKEKVDEIKKKIEEIKEKTEKFKRKVLEKFGDYILGICILPPKPEEKEKINVLILVDDSDRKKMTQMELKEKLVMVMRKMASDIDQNISVDVLLISMLWDELCDAQYSTLDKIVASLPIYDKGMISALKLVEVHKRMVVDKFERYIVCYVLAGSLVQGRATKKSDVDVFIVVDDTDVKRMTRAELKDKLRAIIIGMGIEAERIVGVENKLNVQVYILTDFWENLKEANPIIFTFLRDGVPIYDRGIFMAWKRLLKMGRIRPSREAIDMFKTSGEQILKRVEYKLKEMATEDFFWATLTPTQAAIMLYGLPPPTPKETVDVVKEIFVKKEKMLEQKYVEILDKIIKTRKAIEHGEKKDVSGREIDELLRSSKEYLERLKKLFKDIEEKKEKESIYTIYDNVTMVARDALILEGEKEPISDKSLERLFKEKIINKNYLPEKYYRILKQVIKAVRDYEQGKLTKVEIEQVIKNSKDFITHVVEHIEGKKSREIEKAKIVVKHGDKIGEVLFTDDYIFIIHDINKEDKDISKIKIVKGKLGKIEESNIEELEKAIKKISPTTKRRLNKEIMDMLKDIFGEDMEIVVK